MSDLAGELLRERSALVGVQGVPFGNSFFDHLATDAAEADRFDDEVAHIAMTLATHLLAVLEIASLSAAHEPSVRRLMRALVLLGVFAAAGEDRYDLTPISEYLRTDHPESFRRTAAQLTDQCLELVSSRRTASESGDCVLEVRLHRD